MMSAVRWGGIFILAFIAGFPLGQRVAPDHEGAAIFSAAFMAMALGVAWKTMEATGLLLAPVLVPIWIWQWMTGKRPARDPQQERRSEQKIKRVFMVTYVMSTMLLGAVFGALSGGYGIVSAAVLYGAVGLAFGLVVNRFPIDDF